MRWGFWLLVSICIIAPAASLAYKMGTLDLPLLPLETKDRWNFQLRVNRSEGASATPKGSTLFPLPMTRGTMAEGRFHVRDLNIDGREAKELSYLGQRFVRCSPPLRDDAPWLSVQGTLQVGHHASASKKVRSWPQRRKSRQTRREDTPGSEKGKPGSAQREGARREASDTGARLRTAKDVEGNAEHASYLAWHHLVDQETEAMLAQTRALLSLKDPKVPLPGTKTDEPEGRPGNPPHSREARERAGSAKELLEIARRIFYYLEEEITPNHEIESVRETLDQRRGSSYARAKAFVLLARQQGIPATLVLGADLDTLTALSGKIPLRFAAEVYVGDETAFIDLDRGHFDEMSPYFWPIAKGALLVHDLFENKGFSFDLRVSTQVVASVEGRKSYDTLLRNSPIYRHLSLLQLPLRQQNHFSLLLLLPLAALVLSVMRNVVGVPSFGIFTPVLLGLFFREATFQSGMIVFTLVVMIGFFGRVVLDRLHLLAVPRLSVIMTLVVIGLSIFTIQNQSHGWIDPDRLAFFPLVIVTVFIERLSVTYAEEGFWNTAKDVVGTFAIASVTYLVLMPASLKVVLLTHPELSLWAAAGLLMLGSYRGYRLSELMRFAPAVRNRKAKGEKKSSVG